MNEAHLSVLADALRRGSVLDPIALWKNPETGKLIVADGHHRLEVYGRAGAKRVSALVYQCDFQTALLIPIQENAKTRLPLTYAEKANYAWRLTVQGRCSKATVVASCGISDRTVAYMRKRLKELREKGEEVPQFWGETFERKEWTEEDREDWIDGLINRAIGQCGPLLADLARRCPEALAELLDRSCGSLLPRALEELGFIRVDDEF